MSRSTSFRFAALAPFLLGFSAATAAEIAVGVLLYASPGLVRSLTIILAVESAALGVGMWAAARGDRDIVESVRRRWLLCLTSFLVAAGFATAWSLVDDMGREALGQGLGLALLGALPLYACGGALATVGEAVRRFPAGMLPAPGAPAALGAAIGFAVTGVVLPRSATPSSLLLGCILLLSVGGLAQGAALARCRQTRVLDRRPGPAGDVTVEDRHLVADRVVVRVLLEAGNARRWMQLSGEGSVPWDVSVMRASMPPPESAWRVLLVGGGASSLARAAMREHPTVAVDVLERSAAVVELGRVHLDTELFESEEGRTRVRVGNLDDLLAALDGTYDLILCDTCALAPLGGASALSRVSHDALRSRLAPGGTLAWGPVPGAPDGDPPAGWMRSSKERVLARHPSEDVGAPGSVLVVVESRESEAAAAGRMDALFGEDAAAR